MEKLESFSKLPGFVDFTIFVIRRRKGVLLMFRSSNMSEIVRMD